MSPFPSTVLVATLLAFPGPVPPPQPAGATALRDAVARQARSKFLAPTRPRPPFSSRRPAAPDPVALKIGAAMTGGIVGAMLGGLAAYPLGPRDIRIGMLGGAVVEAWALVRRVSR